MKYLNTIITADVLEGLAMLPDACIDTCVTSVPYWALRDYGVDGQLGLEDTPEEYIQNMVRVFSEVKRVLKDDGTLWLNIGDSYSVDSIRGEKKISQSGQLKGRSVDGNQMSAGRVKGIKPKDMVGIPWMLAFALRADGWYLRQDIIWHKPNPMPESVNDRCTKAHEYIFLLSKSSRYYYDADSIRTESDWGQSKQKVPDGWDIDPGSHGSIHRNGRTKGKTWEDRKNNGEPIRQGLGGEQNKGIGNFSANEKGANKRSVWTVSTKAFREAHFATFPPELIVDPIKAGCPEGGIVLDPFMGAGTTAVVAQKLGRNYVGIEINPDYVDISNRRLYNELGMFVNEEFNQPKS